MIEYKYTRGFIDFYKHKFIKWHDKKNANEPDRRIKRWDNFYRRNILVNGLSNSREYDIVITIFLPEQVIKWKKEEKDWGNARYIGRDIIEQNCSAETFNNFARTCSYNIIVTFIVLSTLRTLLFLHILFIWVKYNKFENIGMADIEIFYFFYVSNVSKLEIVYK